MISERGKTFEMGGRVLARDDEVAMVSRLVEAWYRSLWGVSTLRGGGGLWWSAEVVSEGWNMASCNDDKDCLRTNVGLGEISGM